MTLTTDFKSQDNRIAVLGMFTQVELIHNENQLELPHSVSRTLRSTGANLLHVPKSNIVKGDRAFMIAGPKVWNSLPSNIRAITNLVDFNKKLQTFFYRKAFM